MRTKYIRLGVMIALSIFLCQEGALALTPPCKNVWVAWTQLRQVQCSGGKLTFIRVKEDPFNFGRVCVVKAHISAIGKTADTAAACVRDQAREACEEDRGNFIPYGGGKDGPNDIRCEITSRKMSQDQPAPQAQ